MNKRIIFLFFASLFFMGSVTFYINSVTIPKDIKKLVLQESQQFLGRKTQLKGLHFNPLTGITIDGITIFEEDSPDIFATIDRVRVHILYWPFFRHQKIILSSLELKGVSLNLIHYAEGQWNFSDIIKRRSQQRTQQTPKVFLSRLILSGGYLKLTNLEDNFQFSEVFDPIEANINLSVSKGVEFETSVRYADQQKFLELSGTYHPLKSQLTADIRSNGVTVKQYLDLTQTQLPFELKDISINSLDVALSLRKHLLEVSGDLNLGALDLRKDQTTVQLRSLLLRTFTFGYHDGEVRFKGQIAADGPKVMLADRSYASEGISAQINDFTSRGQAIDVSGSLNSQKTAITVPGSLTAAGDINLNDLKFSRSLNALTANGALELKNMSLSVGENIRMSGDFLSPSLVFINSSGTSTVKGDLYTNNLIYAWPPGKELRGQVALTNIQVLGNDRSQWTAKSQLQAQRLQLKLPKGNTLATDLSGQTTIQFTPKEKTFNVSSSFQLSNAAFAVADRLRLTGNPSGTVVVSSKTDPSQSVPYNGTLEFKDGALQGLKFGPVEAIHGTVAFANDQARTTNLNVHALGMPALLTGTLDDFSSPSLDITVHVNNFDLAAAEKIVPDVIHNNSLLLAGTAPWLNVSYQGAATTTDNANIAFEALLSDASVTVEKISKTASNISGEVRYEDKKLFWKELKASFNGKPYLLNGSMVPSSHPTIETDIEAEKFKVKTRLEYAPDQMTFQQLIGRYKNAVFNLAGSTRSIPGGGTIYDLTGEADLDLNDLPEIFPHINDGIKNCRLSGKTHIKGSFKGDPAHWQDWQYDLTGVSPEFSIWDLKVQNMKFNAVQKNNLLKPFHIWGEFYSGDLNVVASLDTAKKELPFEIVTRILNADLNKLRADTPLKKQTMAGSLSATAILNGNLTDLKTIGGKGGIEIKDGMLWELDLLKGLGGILLIPEYKDIVFTQAGMNFTLANGLMSTENIQLLGPSLSLFGKGTLDFSQDQTLNLLLSPDFNTSVIVGSSSLKKGTTAIITGTEKFMSVEVTGNLKKPQYKVNNAPVKILQKTGGVILENVSQFFQNIF